MIGIPQEVEKIIDVVEAAGFPVYLVGGGLRDMLLGRKPKDWDLATSASADLLTTLFPGSRVVGVSFGVVQVPAADFFVDVATFRVDGTYSDYRRPDEVTFTNDLETDLSRRDFTMNAMAGHPRKGIIDPFHGKEDLENHLIRTVGEPALRFQEDPLRMLRGIRFAAQLGFDLEGDTFKQMQNLNDLLEKISAERIREELVKILLAPNCGKGLQLAMETGLMRQIIGTTCADTMSEEEEQSLVHLTAYLHQTKNALDLRIALFYLCFDQGRVEEAIYRLKWDKVTEGKILAGFTYLPQLADIDDRLRLKQFIFQVGFPCYVYLEDLLRQQLLIEEKVQQQKEGHGTEKQKLRNHLAEDIFSKKEPVFLGDLAVHGKALMNMGISEGPEVGRILHLLLDEVHQEPGNNNQQKLLALAEQLKKRSHESG